MQQLQVEAGGKLGKLGATSAEFPKAFGATTLCA
jgi:hypothetical protein